MRRGLILCLLLATACAGSDGQMNDSATSELVAFDHANPDCQLWTNWNRMCSRTGPNGDTHCVRDPDRSVTPSAPFCVIEGGKVWFERDWTAEQRASAERFCNRAEDMTVGWSKLGPTGELERYSATARGCTEFDPDRPFNGKRVSARRHPWCLAWGRVREDKVACTERGSKRDGPSCGGLAMQRHADKLGLFCGERAVPDWCPGASYSAGGNFPLPDDFALPNGEELIIVGPGSSLHEQEVVGVYCAWSRTE